MKFLESNLNSDPIAPIRNAVGYHTQLPSLWMGGKIA